MYDKSDLPEIGVVSLAIAIFAAWHLGYRNATLVLIVAIATLALWFFGIIFVGILLPPQLKRFDGVEWFNYDHRYSPAIWAGGFVISIVIAFSLGYYRESLDQNVMFFFVTTCATL